MSRASTNDIHASMSDPPVKKRKTTTKKAAELSDSEDDAPVRPRRRTKPPSTAAATATRKQPARKKPSISPRKPHAKDRSLLSFFNTQQQTSQPIPDEQLDIISSDDSDAGHKPPPTARKAPVFRKPTQLAVSKPGSLRIGHAGNLAFKVRPPTPRTPVVPPSPPLDPRPWPERFAPENAQELVVHKAKIEQVRLWLSRALEGEAGHRLLVLTGSAGVGKTVTVQVLARELGVEVLEWKNPSSAPDWDREAESAFSSGLNGLFEEFVGRAGQFGCLDIVGAGGTQTAGAEPGRKVVLIEDFPNTLTGSSNQPLLSFRHTIKSFLALPAAAAVPPLILIVTETASVTGPDSFTAHKLLTPAILHHPQCTVLPFNKVAPTYLARVLKTVATRTSLNPPADLITALASSGDIRAAIMTLEFLHSHHTLPPPPAPTGRATKKPKKTPAAPPSTASLLASITRESSYSLFHAAGKILYNKRNPDLLSTTPLLPEHPHHTHPIAADLATLLPEIGAEPHTFLATLHENYLGSVNLAGSLVCGDVSAEEALLDCAIACIDALSVADQLLGDGWKVRSEEAAFQVGCRGVMAALPDEVKREGAAKMYYPTGERLWKVREEVEGAVEWWAAKERVGRGEAMERLAYVGLIQGGDEEVVAKVCGFRGVGGRSEEVGEEKDGEEGVGGKVGRRRGQKVVEDVEKWVLSEDDIEEF